MFNLSKIIGLMKKDLKIKHLFLMLFFCMFGAMAQAQNVNIDVENATLRQVFKIVEKQTPYRFSYRSGLLDNRKDITMHKKNASVASVLDVALSGRNLRYEIVSSKSIVITDKAVTISQGTQAGKSKISGVVKDKEGEPIIGATVKVKGTSTGAITDYNGRFSVNAAPGSELVVSYVGFKTEELPAENNMNIRMSEDAKSVDEVVVVGYGTMKKSDMTGAISSVDVKDLTKRATTNAAEALQGKVAGVTIKRSSGAAGAGVSVKIRGVKTFGDNEPLYIIDGFPGSITSINPQDIESMEILKDGAAAAIYGSVAANGVILVTTKNGKKGDLKIDFSTYLSFTSIAKKMEMLNADGYRKMHGAMYENYNAQYPKQKVPLPLYVTKESDVDTDWQDAVERNGFAQNYMISLRGGSEKSLYSLSYNHAMDQGIMIGNKNRHDIVRMKWHGTKGFMDFDANMSLKYRNYKGIKFSLKEMYMLSPLVPVYDSNNKYGYGLSNFNGLPSNRNIVADDHYRKSANRYYNADANIAITFHILPWMNFKTSYGYRGSSGIEEGHTPTYTADPKSPNLYPSNSDGRSYWEDDLWENVLSMQKDFGKHGLNLMLGSSVNGTKSNWNYVGVDGKKTVYSVQNGELNTEIEPAGFLSQDFRTIDAGEGGTFSGGGSKWLYRRASFFGRFNYNYDNRYLLQFTMRRDGSSKFGSDSRWGNFPSLALGWRLTEEKFFPKNTAISNLKLRASWGKLGNENALGFYDFLALIHTGNYLMMGYVEGTGKTPWPGSIATGLENRTLKWETTDTKNIGFDFGFFDNKLSGSFNLYRNTTNDLLITRVLAPSVGLDSPTLNVGKIRNQGVELELNWNQTISDFSYQVGFNLSTLNNKVVQLSDKDQVLYGTGLKFGTEHYPTQTRVGRPIGSFYLYQADGIFQTMDEVRSHVDANGKLLQPDAQPGDIRFKDINGDGKIDEDDKIYSGTGMPKVEANLTFSASYKGFDLSMALGSAFGNKLYNGNKYLYEGMNSSSNFLKSSLDAWTPTNTNTNVPRAVYQDPNNNTRESTRFLEKGDFLRMRQLQVGYTLPNLLTKKFYVESLRFYVSAENLFTITGYDGVDPEFSRGVLNTGVDNLIYPFTRSFTIGAQLTF